jgi:cytochrome b
VAASNRVQAWDVPTRVFKWLLVASVAMAWATNKYAVQHPEWHKWSGYAALVLVTFRVLWGFCGGYTARFSSFVAGPRTVARYALAEVQGRERKFLGHNPLGGWMVITLLAAVGTQAVLGLFSAGDDYLSLQGPLAHTVKDATVSVVTHLHRWGVNVILCLVITHVMVNIFYDVFRQAGLIRGMITGRKPPAKYADAAGAVAGSTLTAGICFCVAVLAVFGILRLFS